VTSAGAQSSFTDPSKGDNDTMKDLRDAINGHKTLALAESADDAV
jgi:hypothetical protein